MKSALTLAVSKLAWIVGHTVSIQRIRELVVGARKHLNHIYKYIFHTYYINIYACIFHMAIYHHLYFYIYICLRCLHIPYTCIYLLYAFLYIKYICLCICINRMVWGEVAMWNNKSGCIEKSALIDMKSEYSFV